MPAWWGRRRHKNKTDDHAVSPTSNKSPSFPTTPSSVKSRASDANARSFDESVNGIGGPVSAPLRSPGLAHRTSSGFSGFDSDGYGGGGSGSGAGRECHPLPRPSVSPNSGYALDHNGGGGVDLGNGGSASVSSVSSSGSSDDAPPPLLDQFAQLGVSRGNDRVKLNVRTRSPGPGSRAATTSNSPRHPQSAGGGSPLHPQFGGGSGSPLHPQFGGGSGSPLHPQFGGGSGSPLHPQLSNCSLESPIGKVDDGRSQCHPLPLPPSSPTSPSAVHNSRASFATENTNNAQSKWKKGRLLGRGTFGHVYLGFNSEMGRLCAIKEVRLFSDDQNSKECLKQLNQEINLLNQLSHPNIVRYYGSELGEESLSVHLEYVSGGSIHKLLQEYGAFKEPVIQNYTRQILYGLAYLHARNTLHRDIKGANILVDPNGEIKLADFGMAKHMTTCTSVLSFKGSPYWMSPEVVMNSNSSNCAVDIWSLGCTVLEMATSKPPWSQYEGVAAIFKIGNSKDIPEIPNHLSSTAKNFLRLCLQRDPAARPSAAELLEHPFVANQTNARISGHTAPNEPFPPTSDGNNRPQALEIHPRRKSISSYEVDNMRRPIVPVSRESWDNARTIISLPVSPCSSPLRNTSPAYKSCFLSPPHLSYAWAGQTSQYPNEFTLSPTLSPTRPQPNYLSDPWQDTTLFKAQTPGGSPRSRLL
ncbi:hypothetical protein V2J09_009734 [Rumex salicifolius]